ncbi:MYXO-CTERM sorting domain-containing protein, partial [Myxococcota bacterium]
APSGFSDQRSFSIRAPQADAGVDGGPQPYNPDSGCGCSSAGAATNPFFFAILFLLAMIICNRR